MAQVASTPITRNALKTISNDSLLAKINVTKTTNLKQLYKSSMTVNKFDYDQDVVLSEDDFNYGAKNTNLFGMAPSAKAKKYEILSREPELDDILDKIIDEMIVYANTNYFCKPDTSLINDLNIKDSKKVSIIEDFENAFKRIYYLHAFNGLNSEPNRATIKDTMRKYLVQGRLAYEKVFDDLDKPTEIIAIREINAFALTAMRNRDTFYWQYNMSDHFQSATQSYYATSRINMSQGTGNVILLDSQVIYLTWSINDGMQSYLERLIRAFNLLRIVERSRIVYAATASRFKTLITVPTKGKSKPEASATLRKAMAKYHEKLTFDDQSGEFTVNGEASMPFNTELWTSEGHAGKMTIQNVAQEMPDLNDTSAITFFRNNLQRLSKLPLSRFDEGGGVWNVSDEMLQRDERRFASFIDNELRKFGVGIILNPIYTQMCIDNDEYIGDIDIVNALKLDFNKYNHYQAQIELNLLSKRVDTIDRIKKSLMRSMDISETEKPFWSSRFLIEQYLNLDDDKIALNAKYLKTEQAEIEKLAMEQAHAAAKQEEQTAIAKEENIETPAEDADAELDSIDDTSDFE